MNYCVTNLKLFLKNKILRHMTYIFMHVYMFKLSVKFMHRTLLNSVKKCIKYLLGEYYVIKKYIKLKSELATTNKYCMIYLLW